MSFYGDEDDDGETCRRCGATGLLWRRAWNKAKRCEMRMLHDEGGDLHECPTPDLDDVFEDLTEKN